MDEQLIEAVREFPCIWQLSSLSYKDIRAKENAWKAVAAKVLTCYDNKFTKQDLHKYYSLCIGR